MPQGEPNPDTQKAVITYDTEERGLLATQTYTGTALQRPHLSFVCPQLPPWCQTHSKLIRFN